MCMSNTQSRGGSLVMPNPQSRGGTPRDLSGNGKDVAPLQSVTFEYLPPPQQRTNPDVIQSL